MVKDIALDEEFAKLAPPMLDADVALLEQNILRDGRAIEPLILWSETNILLDGYKRYELCQKLSLPYETVGVSCGDRCDAISWVLGHHLGRRHLTIPQISYMRGKLRMNLEWRKQSLKDSEGFNPVVEAATITGVSIDVIRRDTRMASAVDKIGVVSETARQRILTGDVEVNLNTLALLNRQDDKVISDIAGCVGEMAKSKIITDDRGMRAVAPTADHRNKLTRSTMAKAGLQSLGNVIRYANELGFLDRVRAAIAAIQMELERIKRQ